MLNLSLDDLSEDWHITTSAELSAAITAIFYFGFISAFFSGRVVGKIGNVFALCLCHFFVILGSLLITLLGAKDRTWWAFFLFRGLIGLGCGGFVSITPRYLADVSPAHIRGTIGTLNSAAGT